MNSNLDGGGGFALLAVYALRDFAPDCLRHVLAPFHARERQRERDGRALMLVDFYPKTGRTHQLRRHSKEALGCPILGDARYSFAGEDGSHPDGLFLWATGVIIPADAMPWRGSELVVDSSVGEKFTRAFGVVSSE